mgnify:CR=1 FL=1
MEKLYKIKSDMDFKQLCIDTLTIINDMHKKGIIHMDIKIANTMLY